MFVEDPYANAALISNFLSTLLYISLFFVNRIRFSMRSREAVYLQRLLIIGMVAGLVDATSDYYYGRTGGLAHFVVYWGNWLVYLSYVVISYYWYKFFQSHLHLNNVRLDRLSTIMAGVGVLLLVLNLFNGWVFTVDEANYFHRQPLYLYYFLMMLAHGAFTIYMYFVLRHRAIVRFFPVLVFALPVMMGELLQLWDVGFSLIFPTLSISLAGILAAMKNEEVFRDQLTGIYNRSYLEFLKQQINEMKMDDVVGLMLDLNRLKSINDNYGHHEGDAAIKEAAHILENAVGVKGSAIRYSGDEFILLVRMRHERDVTDIEERIAQQFEEYNRTSGKPYELSISSGKDSFDAANDSIDDFINRLDSAMYENKTRYYKMTGYNRRSSDR